jgi:NADH-quinone oxidoreductase subunit H
MEALAVYIHENYLYQAPFWLVSAIVQLAACSVVLLIFVAPVAGLLSFIERRIAARIQDRIGPNRVGPQGILQFLADGIKSLLKEDLIPKDADKPLFILAPYLVFLGMFTTFVSLPFAGKLIIADLNVGILYIFATSSLTVVGLVMAGWGSGSKWSMLGGMRAAAQVISYEIPAGLAALTVIFLAGSLSMQTLVRSQGPYPWQWYLFDNPFCLVAFFVLFIALVAEGNRTPFDLPEAESELVSGYNTEYSGMRFVFFFFAEWANLYIIGAILSTLFLGGWQIPQGLHDAAAATADWLPSVLQLLVFQVKSFFLVFLIIQLRWTVPRIRMDQLMSLCWKYLVPIGFVCVMGVAIWMMLWPQGIPSMRYVLTVTAAVVTAYYFYRVYWQLKSTRSEIQLNPFV